MARRRPVPELFRAFNAGERSALSQALSLVESELESDERDAEAFFDLLSAVARDRASVRIGITGTPGVGKSTLIEALGCELIRQGRRVAVLAIDPSSVRTQGSLLADQTRMEQLSRLKEAFIRPSPSRGELGGVARGTFEAMILCEAFGFDVILVETVGVGQSEIAVENLVDDVWLLVQPGAGDELQALKRGTMEIADLLLVSKSDGPLSALSDETLHTLKELGFDSRVFGISSVGARTDSRLVDRVRVLQESQQKGSFLERRDRQAQFWFEVCLEQRLWRDFKRRHSATIADAAKKTSHHNIYEMRKRISKLVAPSSKK